MPTGRITASMRCGCCRLAARWRGASARGGFSRSSRQRRRLARRCIWRPMPASKSGDRRFGGDLGHHGGGDALCVPARRSAQHFRRNGDVKRLSRAGDPAHAACCAIRGCWSSWRSGSGSIFCSGLGRCRSTGAIGPGRPGRRISAVFSPACCCFPGSIRAPTRAAHRRYWCNAAINRLQRGVKQCDCGTSSTGGIILTEPAARQIVLP